MLRGWGCRGGEEVLLFGVEFRIIFLVICDMISVFLSLSFVLFSKCIG